MISLTHVIIIALIQGLSEFLPVSSSAHLIIIPKLLGWQDQGQVIDVAVHFGTLGAVACYFWRDLLLMLNGIIRLTSEEFIKGRQLFMQLIVATIPAVVIGSFVNYFASGLLRGLSIIAWSSLIFGGILYLADLKGPKNMGTKDMTYGRAFLIGLIQSFAFIPGASRLGSCLTAFRILGFNRTDSVHYAYLMSMPLIIAATALVTYKALKLGSAPIGKEVLLAVGLSFLVGLGAINFMMRWVRQGSFAIFAIYRILLGLGLLWFGKDLVIN